MHSFIFLGLSCLVALGSTPRLDTLARTGVAAALLGRDGFHIEVVAVSGSRPVAHALGQAGISLYRPLATDSSLAGGVRYFLARDPDSTVVQVFGPLRRPMDR